MTPNTNPCGHKDATGNRDCTEFRFKNGATYCLAHEAEYKAARRSETPRAPRAGRGLDFSKFRGGAGEAVSDDDLAHSHEYVPMPELVALWHATLAVGQDEPAPNLMFVGPSGCGKTDGAKYLAGVAGLAFTKVDSASMTDAESWFGTRELVVRDGHAVTSYEPSEFVLALQRAGVLFIDEVNRVDDRVRQVLLPALDMTRSVMNPLTGEVIVRHSRCFIIMAGNIGLRFTGTSAIDPAFMTRSVVVEFDYISGAVETKVVQDASRCDDDTAAVLVRFASETRDKAKTDPDFAPVSTREIIEAARLVARGLSRDLAVKFVVLNGASSEGGSESTRQVLQNIWNGVRVIAPRKSEAVDFTGMLLAASGWACPVHAVVKVVPAGISKNTGKPYTSFKACPQPGCPNTESRSPMVQAGPATITRTCSDCGASQPAGRTTICVSCGSASLR